jgi:transposase InsO family protein
MSGTSNPAAVIKKLCECACQRFGQDQYQNLAIGIRRKPCPNDQPGYIRIDSAHQGDQDKRQGIYHINAVDAITQFQVIVTVERISEAFMLPAIQQILAVVPFEIQGLHADNGGEYINGTIAALLDKRLIEFTKSRPRHSNDNVQVESKNDSIVRKLYGYEHIPQHHASQLSTFNQTQVDRYMNFHRPCYFPTTVILNSDMI